MTLALDVLTALAALTWLAGAWRVTLVAARMLQIEEYENRRLLVWGCRRAWLLHPAVLVATAAPLAGIGAAAFVPHRGATVISGAWLVGGMAIHVRWRWAAAKKALVFTARMRRLLALTMLLAAVAAALVALLVAGGRSGDGEPGGMLAAIALLGLPSLVLGLLVIANVGIIPVEAAIRAGFVRRAERRLRGFDPAVIAVAGSYGKTTTKHILAHLLQGYGETLATPRSFNTLMGVTRSINELLAEHHRTLVVEMDAYGPGEIAAISALCRPRVVVITSVGPAHLERFGTLDRSAAALHEAVAALPADGVAVVYVGDRVSAALAARAIAEGRRVVRYRDDGDDSPADVVARGVVGDATGVRFTWAWPDQGLEHEVVVPLLGRHQAANVSAALAVVHLLGHDLGPALARVPTLQPVEHRLQPVPTRGGITVIDDSYNANPVGVHNGLEVLAQIRGGVKILVTPGMVELGSLEESENHRYGEHAAAVCDHVIVMNARPGQWVRRGLAAGGLGAERVHSVDTLAEATALIGRLARPGDVVLFANDLPDTYL